MFEDRQQPHHRCCGVVKRICHSCKCEADGELLVPCRAEGCHKFFCRRCLTSRYKFSKAKASHLPSQNWRCPACTRRCYCTECVLAGTKPKQLKPIKKLRTYVKRGHRRKKSRLRKACPSSGSQSPLATYHSWLVVGPRRQPLTCGTCGHTSTASASLSKACSSCSTPRALKPSLPPLSTYPGLSLTPAPRPFPTRLAPPDVKLAVPSRVPLLYDGSLYESMGLLQLLRIAYAPFAQVSTGTLPYSFV
jgi:hypothetical protein